MGGREGKSHGASQRDGEVWGATSSTVRLTGNTGRKSVMEDREPGSTESPGSAVLSLLVPGENSSVALSTEGLLSQREQNPASFCLSDFLRVL